MTIKDRSLMLELAELIIHSFYIFADKFQMVEDWVQSCLIFNPVSSPGAGAVDIHHRVQLLSSQVEADFNVSRSSLLWWVRRSWNCITTQSHCGNSTDRRMGGGVVVAYHVMTVLLLAVVRPNYCSCWLVSSHLDSVQSTTRHTIVS